MNTKHTPAQVTKSTLRLPPELATRLKRLAKTHSRSLHGEIVWALREYVERHEPTDATTAERE